MKKILLFLIFSVSLFAYGQNEQLPESILHSFNVKFPQVKSFDDWEFAGEVYSIDFYRAGTMYTARFNNEGVWIETGEIISDSDIPSGLQSYAKKNYPGLPICYCEKVEKSGKQFLYRVCIRNDTEEIFITSDLSGKNIMVLEK